MTGFTLAAINVPGGQISVSIETDLLSIAVPKDQTFVALGPREERLDEEAGVFELETMEFQVIDSYEDHAEGFWFKLLRTSTTFRIQVQIDEGSGPREFFYGDLEYEETEFDEDYIGSPKVRRARFKCVNVASTLWDLDMRTFENDVYAQSALFNTGAILPFSNFVRLIPAQDFVGCALKAAGLNSTVLPTRFQYDVTKPDLKFINASTTEYQFGGADQVWIPVTFRDLNAVEQKHYYWTGTGSGDLAALYDGDFKACLGDYLYNFGFYLRVVKEADGFHGVLYQRHGRAYSGTLDMANYEKESTVLFQTPSIGSGVFIRNKYHTNQYFWIHDEGQTGSIYAPSEHLSFDVERNMLWVAQTLGFGPGYTQPDTIGVGASLGAITQAVNFKFYDYYTGGTVSVLGTTQNCRLQHAIAGYYYWKFKTQDQKIVRRYHGITANDGATTSFQHVNVFRRVSINDGATTDNYQASRVTIDPFAHETEIEWVKE